MAKSTKGTSESGTSVARPILSVPVGKRKQIIPIILMALYQFANNGLVSGRTGGDVKMRNGRSRGMKVPALVRNTYTSRARGILSTQSSAWNALTDAQRADWLDYKVASSDRFGVVHMYSGKTAFVRINSNLSTAGESVLTVPDKTATAPSATTFTDPLTATISNVNIKNAANAEGAITLIYATSGLRVGINRPSQSAYRLIGVGDTSSSALDISALYIAKFGAPIVGTKIFVQTRVIGAGTGISSAITENIGIVS